MSQSLQATEELVARARGGDREAFARLFRQHSGLVAAVVAAHAGGSGEVEDLVQETFMTAWREMGALRRPESFGPWVSSIARNTARAAVLERSRRGRLRPPESRKDAAPHEGLYRQVLAEIEALPDGYREVFLLRYVRERDCASIARELGLPLGTVTSRLSRGHAMLRERLERMTAG